MGLFSNFKMSIVSSYTDESGSEANSTPIVFNHETDEPTASAHHRANDRLKLVRHYALELSACNHKQLQNRYFKAFGTTGYRLDKQDKLACLMKLFVAQHQPPNEYKHARELYNRETVQWQTFFDSEY